MTVADGVEVWSYLLAEEGGQPAAGDRGIVFYLGGSDGSVQSAMGPMAGLVMLGMRVVLVERRGIAPDGTVDPELLFQSEDKATRVHDALAVMAAHLAELTSSNPVLLVGASEGADIAAAVAAADRRVSHLVLLGGGGGMSQAEELALLVGRDPEAYGIGGSEALQARFEDIRAHPDAETSWLGHPYRRWSSYLWSPPTPYLLSLDIPVFLAQGDADTAVPVESARALDAAFSDAGKTNLRYREYPGVDHTFRDGSGRSALPLVEVDLLAWLRDVNLIGPDEYAEHLGHVHSAHPELFR
ncbi:MAG: alpha/beta hydrolase [Bradymonadales bacterium]|nr:alpha/beta hydrolase [Bradymonadales bacterium]